MAKSLTAVSLLGALVEAEETAAISEAAPACWSDAASMERVGVCVWLASTGSIGLRGEGPGSLKDRILCCLSFEFEEVTLLREYELGNSEVASSPEIELWGEFFEAETFLISAALLTCPIAWLPSSRGSNDGSNDRSV